MNLLDLQEPWLSQCTLTDELLKIYMDPHLLPKSWDQRGKPVKRQRKDVEQYRIKHPHGTFGCIMWNYSYGHLLPDTSLQHSGLFGTLIALPTGLRFMSIPEILMSLTTVMPCWLPEDHRTCIRLLGNSIAVPHALLALTNAMGFLFELSSVEVRELMMQAMSKRMTSRNLHWERRLDGFLFSIDDESCMPTLSMHEHACRKNH